MLDAHSRLDRDFTVGADRVSVILVRPPDAVSLFVFAHGAGAGMRHPFMEALTRALADRRVATFRYQFPYMEAGRRAPNSRPVLLATVRAAVETAREVAGDLPMTAGGKSMGGRMTSLAAAEQPLPGVRGLVFVGFPLHAAGRPPGERGRHLADIAIPMLFLQGTRDKLADLEHLTPVCAPLAPRAKLHVVEGGDHSFHVLKRSGRTDEGVFDELADTIAAWSEALTDVG